MQFPSHHRPRSIRWDHRWYPSNGYTYQLVSQGSWTAAEAFAVTLGGHLASVHNSTDNLWMLSTFAPIATSFTGVSSPVIWIGLYDPVLNDGAQHAADFIWIDGTPVNFTAWGPSEPSNTGSNEYYAALRGPGATPLGSWNDIPNSGGPTLGGVFGIVEVVPEPQVYSYALVSVIAFFVMRRKQSVAC